MLSKNRKTVTSLNKIAILRCDRNKVKSSVEFIFRFLSVNIKIEKKSDSTEEEEWPKVLQVEL